MLYEDDFFGPPIIDKDEWRDQPVRHRFVHGHFEDTDTRFVFWFPDAARYGGRFIQFLQGGMGGSEYQGQLIGAPLIAFENGAYYVESNQGHIGNDMRGIKGQNTVLAWRASAITASFGRELAQAMYGEYPHHGYIFGGSGGGMRSIECHEAPTGLWQGSVPFIVNRNGILQFNWSIAAWAGTILADKIPAIVDALDPGGGGNPFSVLADDVERQALSALYRAGYCRGAEQQLEPNPLWILGMNLLRGVDPAYFTDFWQDPDYEGAQNDGLIDRMLIEEKTRVTEVLTGQQFRKVVPEDALGAAITGRISDNQNVAIRVASPNQHRYLGASLQLPDGRTAMCSHAFDGLLLALHDVEGFAKLEVGAEIKVSSRDLIAYAFYHRHYVDEKYKVMQHFFVDGKPMYKQRPKGLGRVPVPSGRFAGKMILIQNLADRECWPNCAVPYVEDVRKHSGDRYDQNFRIYWTENAPHVPPLTRRGLTRLIQYSGCYAQAVRDLVAWVEDGKVPPPSTRFDFDGYGHLSVPETASERLGLQPVVQCDVEGSNCVTVPSGTTVNFTGKAEAAPHSGFFVSAEWDFDGSGAFAAFSPVPKQSMLMHASAQHRYDTPGTWFVTFRVGIQREGDKTAPLRKIVNQARLRVVVTGGA